MALHFGVDEYGNLLRRRELRQFEEFLQQSPYKSQFGQLLYLQGMSGVGKTTLLDQFAKIAKGMNFEWVLVNGKDSMYSEGLFVQTLLRTLGMDDKYHGLPEIDSLHKATSIMNKISKNKCVVFVIDGYEYLLSQDVFIRLHLLSKLDAQVRIVITSTEMLPTHWITDLHPQRRITRIEVQPFSYQEVMSLLSSHHLDSNTCNRIWKMTKGHSLSIVLALSMMQSNSSVSLDQVKDGVIDEMSRYWYQCIPDKNLKDLVTVSSLLFQFNQEILEYVLEEEISPALFDQLTSLSFCRPTKKGWYIHDLVREAVYTDFQRRLPSLYQEYMKRCAFYYYHLLKDSFKKQENELVEEFYHFYFFAGVPYIRDLYFKGKVQSTNYFEWMNPTMYQEVQDYIHRRKQTVTVSSELIELDGMTEEKHRTLICNEFDLIRPQEFLEYGRDSVRLLRDEDREIIGLSIVLPIHKYFNYLREQPVIGHYLHYADNSESDLKQGSNWFLRMFDSIVPMTEEIVRSDILKGLLSYIGPNRLLVTSIPYPGLAMVLESLGFQKIPNLIHYDFGKDFPAPTFVLDLRGENFYSFLDNKMEQAGYTLPQSHKFSFTRREQEVANLILACKSNEEIASDLHITVVTVKKHIGNLFQKTGVKNRAQFIHLMLKGEVVYGMSDGHGDSPSNLT